MREFELVRRLAQRLQSGRADTRFGVGDDAAVIAPPPGRELVVTTDTLVAGRHFTDDAEAADIGYKALAVSFSDVSAMGGAPAWATLALTVPDLESVWCEAFVDGALQAASQAGVDIVGGDTTRGPLAVSATVFGLVRAGGAVMRAGAMPGDWVCVTGTLGDAALGLRLWLDSGRAVADANRQWLHRRYHRPEWRDGRALADAAHAAIDVSDGLLADLGHILTASGVGARIDAGRLPSSPAFDGLCPDAHRHRYQLAGGDDYELCVVLPPGAHAELAAALDCRLTPIGTIEAQAGLRVVDSDGTVLGAGDYPGWDHFR